MKVGQATASEFRVELLPSKVRDGKIKISFPKKATSIVYELLATARMTDALGFSGEVHHQLWSHVLSDESQAKLVNTVMRAAASGTGMPVDTLMTASALEIPPDDKRASDPRFRRARTLRLMAMSAAEDRRITPGELRALFRGAELDSSGR